MSPPVATWVLAVMAFSPFAAAWPRTCPASCVVTVTTTVTSVPSCSVLFSGSVTSASSATESSLANTASTSTHEQGKHHHHHHHTSASWFLNSTGTAVASSNVAPFSSGLVSSGTIQGSSAGNTGSIFSTFYTSSHNSVSTTSGAALSASTPASPPNDCQADNCLRDFIRHPEVTGFCAAYTTDLNTATTGLPSLVSMCQNSPSRISSACSCVVTGASTSTPTSTPTPPANDCQHDNCLRHFIRHPEATGFCATYTTELNTATTGLPALVSQCQYDPTRISSACSCIATGTSSPTSALGAQITTTNAGTFTNAGTSSTTSPSGAAQTSSTSESNTCPVVFATLTVTQTFVSTFTSATWSTSSAGLSAFATTTTDAAVASSSIGAAASTFSLIGHRHRHGHGHEHGQ
ncbi:hypothetical protein V8E51_002541 [Hyaloscypha variabilis]